MLDLDAIGDKIGFSDGTGMSIIVDGLKKYFDPEKSIKTTNIFGNYPEYAKEIEYIEKHLSEYLYDY